MLFLHAYRYAQVNALTPAKGQALLMSAAFPHQPDQMRDESIVERTVRAVNHMRLSLLSGYTTYRDLGTEGLASHDASLRDAVNRGLPPGPRLFVATSCLATTGSYAIRTENYANGMMPPPICDSCDDVDGVRRLYQLLRRLQAQHPARLPRATRSCSRPPTGIPPPSCSPRR